MTIKTFWLIFLKILGIYLVMSSITVIPEFIFSLFSANQTDSSFNLLSGIGILISTVLIYLFILNIFVYRPSWLINKLSLEKGFEEERIDLNIQYPAILNIAIIVIGGLMFVDALPELCKQIFDFFQQKNVFREDPNVNWLFVYLAKTILGYLLTTKSKAITAFINKQTDKDNLTN